MSTEVIRVNVFVDSRGRFGNPLTIVSDGSQYNDENAVLLAKDAGTSETVFIDDEASASVRIFVPTRRVPFAGHPLVGVAWYLNQLHQTTTLRTDVGAIRCQVDGARATVEAPSGQGVPWKLIQLSDVDAVDRADSSGEARHDYVWAWENQRAGLVRARAFTSVSGTVEDEATGSAAVELCNALGVPVSIRQGAGFVIRVAPGQGKYRLQGRITLAGHQPRT